jgi:hypothetical protein
LSCTTNEWPALNVFICSRGFADKHQIRVGISFSEYDCFASAVKLAARAISDFIMLQFGEKSRIFREPVFRVFTRFPGKVNFGDTEISIQIQYALNLFFLSIC